MNILLITTQYPCFDRADHAHTEYMHMYNRAFVQQGNTVIVFHLERKYPSFLIFIAKILMHFSTRINRLFGLYVSRDDIKTDNFYTYDNVSIFRFVIKKTVPHGNFSHTSISKAKRKMRIIIDSKNIYPHVIITEFANPSLFFVDMFPNTPLIFSPHKSDIRYLHNNHELVKIAQESKLIFAKSMMQVNQLIPFFDKQNMFMLYGLVPHELFAGTCRVVKRIYKFITVSRLVKGKNITNIIDALVICGIKEYDFEIIGDGPDRENIWQHIERNRIVSRCHMTGALEKAEVLSHMRGSDCFIMISDNETFGLVYIEAMASGCITIGSKNEGIDGVIVDGVNGYLCSAGDSNQLARLILTITNATPDELERVSRAGYHTAEGLSDSKYPVIVLEKISSILGESM